MHFCNCFLATERKESDIFFPFSLFFCWVVFFLVFRGLFFYLWFVFWWVVFCLLVFVFVFF